MPRKASVRILTRNSGPLCSSACRIVEISSRSVLPMYSVDRKIRLLADKILAFRVA